MRYAVQEQGTPEDKKKLKLLDDLFKATRNKTLTFEQLSVFDFKLSFLHIWVRVMDLDAAEQPDRD